MSFNTFAELEELEDFVRRVRTVATEPATFGLDGDQSHNVGVCDAILALIAEVRDSRDTIARAAFREADLVKRLNESNYHRGRAQKVIGKFTVGMVEMEEDLEAAEDHKRRLESRLAVTARELEALKIGFQPLWDRRADVLDAAKSLGCPTDKNPFIWLLDFVKVLTHREGAAA